MRAVGAAAKWNTDRKKKRMQCTVTRFHRDVVAGTDRNVSGDDTHHVHPAAPGINIVRLFALS